MNPDKNDNNNITEILSESKIELIEELSQQLINDLKKIPSGSNCFVLIKGPSSGEKFVVNKDFFKIGRSFDSDMLLDDITVSRNHAVLLKKGNDLLIKDNGSLNGTYVNGTIIEEEILKNGDKVQIGKYIFLYISI